VDATGGQGDATRGTGIRRTLDALAAGDPRVDPTHYRVADGEAGTVVLVGVVHDHPASRYRTRAVVDALSPATVAIETPPALVPTFEARADRGDDAGGEMTDAVASAGSARVVGIDAPAARFLPALARELRSNAPSLDVVRDVSRSLGRMTLRALRVRFGRAGASEPTRSVDEGSASAQAENERSRLRESDTLLAALDPPLATRILDSARERHMAARLRALRARGGVAVAVVGFAHLDAVADAL